MKPCDLCHYMLDDRHSEFTCVAIQLEHTKRDLFHAKMEIESWKDAWFRQRLATGKYGADLHKVMVLIRKLMDREPHPYSDRVAALYEWVRRG